VRNENGEFGTNGGTPVRFGICQAEYPLDYSGSNGFMSIQYNPDAYYAEVVFGGNWVRGVL
jgi:hypothetical protein